MPGLYLFIFRLSNSEGWTWIARLTSSVKPLLSLGLLFSSNSASPRVARAPWAPVAQCFQRYQNYPSVSRTPTTCRHVPGCCLSLLIVKECPCKAFFANARYPTTQRWVFCELRLLLPSALALWINWRREVCLTSLLIQRVLLKKLRCLLQGCIQFGTPCQRNFNQSLFGWCHAFLKQVAEIKEVVGDKAVARWACLSDLATRRGRGSPGGKLESIAVDARSRTRLSPPPSLITCSSNGHTVGNRISHVSWGRRSLATITFASL